MNPENHLETTSLREHEFMEAVLTLAQILTAKEQLPYETILRTLIDAMKGFADTMHIKLEADETEMIAVRSLDVARKGFDVPNPTWEPEYPESALEVPTLDAQETRRN